MGAGVSVREGALARAGILPPGMGPPPPDAMPIDDEIGAWEAGLRRQSNTPFKQWPEHDAGVEHAIHAWETSLASDHEREALEKETSPPTPATPGTGLKHRKYRLKMGYAEEAVSSELYRWHAEKLALEVACL